jgi:hypothetical protein
MYSGKKSIEDFFSIYDMSNKRIGFLKLKSNFEPKKKENYTAVKDEDGKFDTLR